MTDSPDIRTSKKLSWILRHGASQAGLAMRPDGSVLLADLLQVKDFRGVGRGRILESVAQCPKQRFAVFTENGEERIRANQGHSLPEIAADQLLVEVRDAAAIPVCLHGTYAKFLPQIEKQGLSRMSRQHIHFATGLPREVKSGMRHNCDTLIFIDVAKAMADGCRFFRSANDVILSPGFDGVIPVEYFSSVQSLDYYLLDCSGQRVGQRLVIYTTLRILGLDNLC